MAQATSKRRQLLRASKKRRRGGAGKGPKVVQRAARVTADSIATGRRGATAAVSGDKPYIVGLIGLLIAGALMLSAPLQSYADGRDRVELLESQLAALDSENATLAQQAEDLRDPEQIELLAREQLGLIKPGEVPYAIVPPNIERPRLAPGNLDGGDVVSQPWYRRAWDGATRWFR